MESALTGNIFKPVAALLTISLTVAIHPFKKLFYLYGF